MSAVNGIPPENSEVVRAASYRRLPLDHLHELLLSDVQRGEHGAADIAGPVDLRCLAGR